MSAPTQPAPPTGIKDENIRSVARALEVLRLLNQRPLWSLSALQLVSGLPKSTLSRLLATLVHEGYVRQELPAGTYRVAARVRELANGYTEESRLIDVARAIALPVTKKIKWPLALGVPDQDAIVVRFSSMPYSPVAVAGSTLGRRHAFHNSAMGLAYLAFCPDHVRSPLLASLAGATLEADCHRVRSLGYAVRHPGGRGGSATLAVPVCRDGAAIGVLATTTYGRSMTETFIEVHAPILSDTAAAIIRSFQSGALP
jgi:IclR family transcriptional regulator, mhp operon transcriptional activator